MNRIAPLFCAAGIVLTGAILADVPGAFAAESSVELAAGGLSFAANPSISMERQDVLVSPDMITLTYTLHNDAQLPQAILITFALPELDTNAVTDGEVILPSADPNNYVQFSPKVDGQAPPFKIEQRATALGLDVSNTLASAGIALFPFGSASSSKLSELSAADRLAFLERGILKEEGSSVVAAWTLKTVAHWRQVLPAGQQINIVHTYRPITGVTSYKTETLQSSRRRSCLTEAQETAIAKLPTEGGVAPTFTSVGFLAASGSDQLGPARRFRILIETADQLTIVATCRDGMKRTGPTQLEWTATDHVLDEDLQILFVR